MSYDFLLLPRHPGQSWREVLDANEQGILEQGDSPLTPAARTRLEQIADHLQAHDPQLERFTTEGYIELTRADDTGIQVSLYPGEAAVAVAYWHTGPAARAVMQIVWAYLVVLEQETGWEVYDGQLGRSLNRGQDLDEVTDWYADLTARLHKRFPEALRPPDHSSGGARSASSVSVPPEHYFVYGFKAARLAAPRRLGTLASASATAPALAGPTPAAAGRLSLASCPRCLAPLDVRRIGFA